MEEGEKWSFRKRSNIQVVQSEPKKRSRVSEDVQVDDEDDRQKRRTVRVRIPEAVQHTQAETDYLENFKKLRDGQMKRLTSLREEQKEIPTANSSEQFVMMMQQVAAFTSTEKTFTSPKVADKRRKRTVHRDSQGEEDIPAEEDDEEGCSSFLTVQPPYLTGEMRPYQLEGLNWLINLFDHALNGILADEMGLGKTFQCVALLGFLKNTRGISGPHLVVCPLSVAANWVREVKRWCPTLSVLMFHGDQDTRAQMKRDELVVGKYDVIVTTYEMVNTEKGTLSRFPWRYIIVDEAHRLKNEESLFARTLRLFRSNHRLLVTGTPLQNNLHELWALLNFLFPELFESSEEFDQWFDAREGTQERDVISQMHKLLKPFMLRRLKVEVAANIPPKKEVYVACGMSEMQREWYTKILAKDAAIVNQGTGTKTKLLNIMMQLRKCCNHPYLFDGAEDGPPFITDEHIVKNSGKMVMLDRLLNRLKEQGHRVLIFCQMTRMLDILEDYFIWRQYSYCRLDGSSGQMEREESMEAFNAPNSPHFVFMLSTRAGGLGINLATADTVILFDSDWNPQMDLQAQDRAHRIGQKKPVTIFRFICDGTVEEKIYQRALKKLYLDAAVIQQGRLVDRHNAANRDELLGMIRFGAEQIFRSKNVLSVTDEDIDIILQRGQQKLQSLSNQLQQNCQMSLLNFSMGIEDANIYEFEGVNYTNQPTKTLYIRGIDITVTEVEIREVFQPHGEIRRIVISPERDAAAIFMGSMQSAISAYGAVKSNPTVGQCKEVEIMYGSKMNLVDTEDISDVFGIKGKRACVVNSDLNAINREMASVVEKKVAGPKLPKRKVYPPWQFFDSARLDEIHDIECAYIIKRHEQIQVERRERAIKRRLDALAARRLKTPLSTIAATASGDKTFDNADESARPSSRPTSPLVTEPAEGRFSPSLPAEAAQPLDLAASNEPSKKDDQNATAPISSSSAPPAGDAEMDDHPMSPTAPSGAAAGVTANESDEDGNEDEEEKRANAIAIDAINPEDGLTSSEKREKHVLLAAGFPNWGRSEYSRFVTAVVTHGKDNIQAIAKDLPEFPEDEIRRYSAAFWSMGPRVLSDWDRVYARIEKAEKERGDAVRRDELIKWKASTWADPAALPATSQSRSYGSAYTAHWDEEEDMHLILAVSNAGYGNWDQVKTNLDAVPHLAFDWAIRARSATALKQRTGQLLRAVERERNPQPQKPVERKARKKQTDDSKPLGDRDSDMASLPTSPKSPM